MSGDRLKLEVREREDIGSRRTRRLRSEGLIPGVLYGKGHARPIVVPERELRAAIERALACGGPAVIHVDVDPVKHMWAPGLMHFKDMHLEPKGK